MTQVANFGAVANGAGNVVRPALNAADMMVATDAKGPTYPTAANQLGFVWCDDSADPVWVWKVLMLGTNPAVPTNWVEIYRVNKNVGGLNPPTGGVFRKNSIINGNFEIWQRGTSLSAAAANRYLADRWLTGAVGTTIAPSRQAFALGQTAVPGEPAFFHRAVVVSSAGAANNATLDQRIEGVRTHAGETITISFFAKADSNKNMAISLRQFFGTGGSPSAMVQQHIGKIALTTNWQKFTFTVAVPSIAGKTIGTDGNDYLDLIFWYDAGSTYNTETNNLGQQSGTFDKSRVQVEKSPVATEFERQSPGQVFADCERYYEQGTVNWSGQAQNGYVYGAQSIFRTLKRGVPTMSIIENINNGFAVGGGSLSGQTNNVAMNKMANATLSGASFNATYFADAEL